MPTPEQIKASLAIVTAVGECIRELGSVPSGHLYAQLMGKLSYSQYESVIRILKNAELIKEAPSHLLVWVGPTITEA